MPLRPLLRRLGFVCCFAVACSLPTEPDVPNAAGAGALTGAATGGATAGGGGGAGAGGGSGAAAGGDSGNPGGKAGAGSDVATGGASGRSAGMGGETGKAGSSSGGAGEPGKSSGGQAGAGGENGGGGGVGGNGGVAGSVAAGGAVGGLGGDGGTGEAAAKFHVFLLLGQSNMEGQPQAQAQDREQNPRIKVLAYDDCASVNREYGKWYTASPPLHSCGGGVGPGDYFAKTLIQSLPEDHSIGLVPCAVNGAPIDLPSFGN